MRTDAWFDWVVIGAGPAGQKAAIQAAKAGHRVAVVERGRHVGGECVHRGTIPSKALREMASRLRHLRQTPVAVQLPQDTPMASLLGSVSGIVDAHVHYQLDQLQRNGITVIHGRARFVDPHHVEIQPPRGQPERIGADRFVIATGSVPRRPPGVPIDHRLVLDSDSILSQPYLPRRLAVLGAGVIGCEYATVFKELGSQVTLIDRAPRPLAFMDPELSERLVQRFEGGGCRYLPERSIEGIERGHVDVRVCLGDGAVVETDKVLVALGRTANVERLGLSELGIARTRRGHVEVDEAYRTSVPHVLAIGDAIGFPALAATSMEQGRRAVRRALGLSVNEASHAVPIGIYTLPELASIGATEDEALERCSAIRIGRCDFAEVARGQIAGEDGMLKLIATADNARILGVHIFGGKATELIHLGQLALLGDQPPSVFVDNTFNFPTLAEAYRIAALALERETALRTATAA
ncbi:MAG TPA: Si-specific NAD(P)(+) transhydrogenase [Deltaproteobacteria bacterium]|nr:Si-specific NAD(P)(+) transhydrogenase [Deltaproteobacteria bacterium]